MKKLKVLRGALIGVFVVAAACCIFTACSSDKDSTDDTPITEMTLSIDNVKRTYLTYQSFSTDGLEAEVKRESGNKETISASYLDVDYSAFDNTKAGEYTIGVSYSEGGVTLSENYDVEVIEEITGLSIEKETVDYTITSDKGATIDLNDMKVYAVNESGVSSSPLSGGAYEIKYYKGGKEIDSISNLDPGIYTIYVYRNVTIDGKYSTIDYECGAYVLCYVNHSSLVSIEFVSGTTSQDLDVRDTMTGTWIFKLTYEGEVTAEVTSDVVSISGIDTKTGTEEGSQRQATVTYTENYVTSTGRSTTNVNVSVGYEVIAGEDQQVVDYSYSYNELETAAYGSDESREQDKLLTATMFTGNNSFLAFVGTHSDNKIRPATSGGIMQIRGEALEVTIKGFGSLTIEYFSGNASNVCEVGLLNGDGYYVKGTASGASKEAVLSGGNGYCYEQAGGTSDTHGFVTFDLEEPGTYIIVADISGDNARGIRVSAIEMTDVYYAAGNEAAAEKSTLDLSLNFENMDLSMPLDLKITATGSGEKKGKVD